MNFVFSSVFMIILLLPGAMAVHSFCSSIRGPAHTIRLPFQDRILSVVFVSLLAHCIAILTIHSFGWSVDYSLLNDLLTGRQIDIDPEVFGRAIVRFGGYTLSVVFICSLFGKALKWATLQESFDQRFRGLNNTNFWFHMFRPFRNGQVFVVVKTISDSQYSGQLLKYECEATTGELMNIALDHASVIYEVSKRIGEVEARYVNMDSVIIPANSIEILELNYDLKFDGNPHHQYQNFEGLH